MRTTMAVLILAMSATVAQADEGVDAATQAFNCASGDTLTVTGLGQAAAEVQFAGQDAVKVIERTAKAGSRYSDDRHELRINGAEASWQVGSRTPVKCTAADATRLAGKG